MIYEIDRNIYRIVVPLAGSPLGTLNAYYFRGGEEEYLMDTGFDTPACEASLRESLVSLGYSPERLNIINTHLHMDHTGLDHRFVGPRQHIYLNSVDLYSLPGFGAARRGNRGERERREGVSENEFFRIMQRVGFERDIAWLQSVRDQFVPLTDGQMLDVGPCTLQTVSVPGHSPGNTMFYLPEKKIMFTGDHVLFDITPNITAYPDFDNSLQHYLDSLETAKRFDVALALPGHRSPGDYYARIEEIRRHHDRRLDEVEDIVGNSPGLTAYEITHRMRWSIHPDSSGSFPPEQMWFAAGECMSHLDKLVADGRVLRIDGEPYITYRLP